MEEKWWCCGVERPTSQRCSCGDKYEEIEISIIKDDKIIACDEAINQISEVLCDASGEFISEIFSRVVKDSIYVGDNLIKIKE